MQPGKGRPKGPLLAETGQTG